MPGWELPIQTILTLALHMPLIDAGGDDKVNVEDMLCSVLHDITLGVDGNISASYVDAAQEVPLLLRLLRMLHNM